ncbi:helix-turn-helix domain-containing protein [Klebsiella indica]|nr:helix-turn-helix domain-containing protein [Klebsiella indica]
MAAREVIIGMLVWIEENIREDIQLRDIETRSGYTRWYFNRVFCQVMDINVAEYIRRRRLTLAFAELKITSRTVSEIAIGLGFGTVQSFCRAFRLQYGCTPLQARRDPVTDFRKQLPGPESNDQFCLDKIIYTELKIRSLKISMSDENAIINHSGHYIQSKVTRFQKRLQADVDSLGFAIEINSLASERRGTQYIHPVEALRPDSREGQERINYKVLDEGRYAVLYMRVSAEVIHRVTEYLYTHYLPACPLIKRDGLDFMQIRGQVRGSPDMRKVIYFMPIDYTDN